MSPISEPQLLQMESVYQVARNPDRMTLILTELGEKDHSVKTCCVFQLGLILCLSEDFIPVPQ